MLPAAQHLTAIIPESTGLKGPLAPVSKRVCLVTETGASQTLLLPGFGSLAYHQNKQTNHLQI